MDEMIIREPLCAGQAAIVVDKISYHGPLKKDRAILYAADGPGIVILLIGQGKRYRDGRSQSVGKNQYFAVGTGTETTLLVQPGTELLFLTVAAHVSGIDETVYTVPPGTAKQALSAIRREIQKKVQGYEMVCQKYIQIFLMELSRYGRTPACFCPEKQNDAVRDIRDYINAHFREKILLTELMERCGLEREELNRAFCAAYGMTPIEYYHQRRVQEGKALLEQTDLPVQEIAENIGFYSNSHFVPAFKKYMGTTQLQYRRQYREKKARKMKEENRQMELSDYLTG